MILNKKELLTELDVLLFEKLEMLGHHSSIEIGLQKKFIVRFDLLRTGGKSHMTSVLLIMQTPVVSLNYQDLAKKLS